MALEAAVARRYARAFAELVDEEGAGPEVAADLDRLQDLLQTPGSEVLAILSNPVFTLAERQAALASALELLGFHPLLGRLLRLLLDKGRFAWLPQVVEAWRERADRQAGRVRATVRTALPLGPALLDEIRERLSRATGAEVIVVTSIDPTLLAGLVVELGGVVYDASLRSRLADLRRVLASSQAIETPEA